MQKRMNISQTPRVCVLHCYVFSPFGGPHQCLVLKLKFTEAMDPKAQDDRFETSFSFYVT